MAAGQAKILVISPKYFPVEEGLGHYTTEFCRHLAERFEVAVWTSRDRGDVGRASGHAPGDVTLIDTVRRWTWGAPFAALPSALRFEPDRVVIQFVSFMYSARGGLNATIVWLALFLAARARWAGRGRVQVMFHELWYPFSWRPKDAVIHLAHRAMVLGLSLASDEVFCATERFAKEVKSMLGPLRSRVHVLVVGSNLEMDAGAPPAAPMAPDDALRIGLFGSLHVSKNVPLVLRSIHEASRKTTRPIRLTIVGASRDEILGAVPELSEWILREVRVLGPLEARDAAAHLAEQDFIVSYFQDGVSSRRGSLLAALCEGVPVVTTWRDVSDRLFSKRPFIELLSCDEATFQRELVAFLTSSVRPFSGVSREEVRAFYLDNFSWRAIVNRYARLSGFRDSPKRATPG